MNFSKSNACSLVKIHETVIYAHMLMTQVCHTFFLHTFIKFSPCGRIKYINDLISHYKMKNGKVKKETFMRYTGRNRQAFLLIEFLIGLALAAVVVGTVLKLEGILVRNQLYGYERMQLLSLARRYSECNEQRDIFHGRYSCTLRRSSNHFSPVGLICAYGPSGKVVLLGKNDVTT